MNQKTHRYEGAALRVGTVLLPLLAVLGTAGAAHAQMGMGGGMGRQQPMPPPQLEGEEEKERPPAEPLPEIRPEMEEARERAKESGVLRSGRAREGVIYEIRVEGARKVEPDAVLVNVQTRIDRPADQRVLQADVRRI